jgi:hypothetical protein
MLIRACAWCEAEKPETARIKPEAGQQVTHGICDVHEAQVREEIARLAAERRMPLAA